MHHQAKPFAVLALLLGCSFLGLTGCNTDKPSGTVKGQVTYKKAAVTGGMLNFYARAKGLAASAKIEAGQFDFKEPLEAGTYTVYVLPPRPEPGDPRKGKPKAIVANVPKKAQDMNTSGLTVEVKPGPNDVTIELRD